MPTRRSFLQLIGLSPAAALVGPVEANDEPAPDMTRIPAQSRVKTITTDICISAEIVDTIEAIRWEDLSEIKDEWDN